MSAVDKPSLSEGDKPSSDKDSSGKKSYLNDNKKDNPNLEIPDDWEYIKTDGFGPFITKVVFRNSQGELIHWESRFYRKHNKELEISTGSTWWAPGSTTWWIGILFAIGSFLFALGSIPSYFKYIGVNLDGLTFFVGSIFFTSAAYLQYLESANAPRKILNNIKNKLYFIFWQPKRIDWLSTLIQLIGTVFFNFSTFNAIRYTSVDQIDKLVWSPDVYGSICFLVASLLAWWEVSHAFWSLNVHKISWWIAFLNLLGSIAFGISAIGAYVLPSTGLPKNELMVNLGTFIGAACFLIGGILLLPERTLEK